MYDKSTLFFFPFVVMYKYQAQHALVLVFHPNFARPQCTTVIDMHFCSFVEDIGVHPLNKERLWFDR